MTPRHYCPINHTKSAKLTSHAIAFHILLFLTFLLPYHNRTIHAAIDNMATPPPSKDCTFGSEASSPVMAPIFSIVPPATPPAQWAVASASVEEGPVLNSLSPWLLVTNPARPFKYRRLVRQVQPLGAFVLVSPFSCRLREEDGMPSRVCWLNKENELTT